MEAGVRDEAFIQEKNSQTEDEIHHDDISQADIHIDSQNQCIAPSVPMQKIIFLYRKMKSLAFYRSCSMKYL